MTDKEIYCTGRAEYLYEYLGYSLKEGYKVAQEEYNCKNCPIKKGKNKQ